MAKLAQAHGLATHLSRLLSEAHNEGVAIWSAGGAIVEVFNDDSLLASISASQEDDNLLRLQHINHRRSKHIRDKNWPQMRLATAEKSAGSEAV